MTTAPIEQSPPESYCAEKIRKYLPEDFLQLLEECGTGGDSTGKDNTKEDEVNEFTNKCSECKEVHLTLLHCATCERLYCFECFRAHPCPWVHACSLPLYS